MLHTANERGFLCLAMRPTGLNAYARRTDHRIRIDLGPLLQAAPDPATEATASTDAVSRLALPQV
jgi:hypothetical protein